MAHPPEQIAFSGNMGIVATMRDGPIEAQEFHSGQATGEPSQQIRLFNRRGEMVLYEIPKMAGGHGGGDEQLLQMLFSDSPPPDPLGHMAGSWAGVMSVLIGVGANKSITSGQPVAIKDLLQG